MDSRMKCSVEGCEGAVRARGRCMPCYQKALRAGEFVPRPYHPRGERVRRWYPIEPLRDDLKRVVKAHGYRRISEKLGLTEGHLHHLLTRNKYVHLDTADRICMALGLPFDEMFRVREAS